MVKHVILWQLKAELTEEEKKAVKRSMYNRADTQALRAKMIFAGRNEALKYHLN